jgi:hypothetical protein
MPLNVETSNGGATAQKVRCSVLLDRGDEVTVQAGAVTGRYESSQKWMLRPSGAKNQNLSTAPHQARRETAAKLREAHAGLPKDVRRSVSSTASRSDLEWLVSDDPVRKALVR